MSPYGIGISWILVLGMITSAMAAHVLDIPSPEYVDSLEQNPVGEPHAPTLTMSNDASVSSANFDSDTGFDDIDPPMESCYSPNAEANVVLPSTVDEKVVTNVYYYCDKEDTPYKAEIEVPPSQLTLGAFKTRIAKPGRYKYFNCRTDEANIDVKVEVKDDSAILLPSSAGIFTVYLVSDETAPCGPVRAAVPALPAIQMRHARSNNRTSHQRTSQRVPSRYNATASANNHRHRRADSYRNVSADDSSIHEPTRFFPEHQRAFSDDDSSVMSDLFTSVSQQRNPVRRRKNRKKGRRMDPSFMSSTVSDDSMHVELMTVHIDLKFDHQLGLTVASDASGIYVDKVRPGSLAWEDGRIQSGMLILEVNGYRLSDFPTEQAIKMLRQASDPHNGQIELTFVNSDRGGGGFAPPLDNVTLPIDTLHWVEQTTRMRAIAEDSTDFPVGNADTTRHYMARPKRFLQHDKDVIAVAMASVAGGVDQRHKVAGKKCFPSDQMVDWLRSNVQGLEETNRCEKFARELVKEGLITQIVDKSGFSRTTSYAFTEKVKSLQQDRRIQALVNGQKPMLDDTLPAQPSSSKGFAAKIKKLFCVNPKTLRTPVAQTHTATSSSAYSDENTAPQFYNYPQQYQQHPPKHYPSTHIP
uniref:PDZ domain-containing protein n=1 Tax=Panagrellus redivivus TaxID=6233 RepID=A0A7E4VLT6_PANRE